MFLAAAPARASPRGTSARVWSLTALPGALNHGTVTGTRAAGQAPKKGPKALS